MIDRTIGYDEKFFFVHQSPHWKNNKVWEIVKPRSICEINDKKDVKVMIFAAIVKGKIPIVLATPEDCGNMPSVNVYPYLRLLQDIIWPICRHSGTRCSLWCMQDGVSAHYMNAALAIFNEKFQCRVISWRTKHPCPAKNSYFKPFVYHFWAAVQNMVYKERVADTLCYAFSWKIQLGDYQ